MPAAAVQKPHLKNRVGEVLPALDEQAAGDELLNVIELAALLHVSKQFLDIARFKGEGPAFLKLGRRVLYRKEDVRQWLKTKVRHKTVAR